jgi:hypothetical protein
MKLSTIYYYHVHTTKMQGVFGGGKPLLQVGILWYEITFKIRRYEDQKDG